MTKTNRRWTDRDITTLKAMRSMRYSYAEIAREVGRTEKACWQKMHQLERAETRQKRATNKSVSKPVWEAPSTTPPPSDRTLVVGLLSGLSGLLLGSIITILTH